MDDAEGRLARGGAGSQSAPAGPAGEILWRQGEALDESCWRVAFSPSSHSRGSSGREIVFHMMGDAPAMGEGGLGLGACDGM